jgi:hypothetical protein
MSVKDTPKIVDLHQWPPDAHHIDEFDPQFVSTELIVSSNNDGTLELNLPAAKQQIVNHHIREALGLGVRPRNDVIHFDEFAYTYRYWGTNVELMSRIREIAHANGTLVSVNLGGWGWAYPFNLDGRGFGLDIVDTLPQLVDSVAIEGVWSRNPSVRGGTFRNIENTTGIIENLRAVMDRGANVMLIPTFYDISSNFYAIRDSQEVHDEFGRLTGLLITTTGDHHIFPHAGLARDRVRFRDLPEEYKFLEGKSWEISPIAGRNDQILLTSLSGDLTALKQEHGIAKIRLASGRLQDMQASVWMDAALAMLARRPGDKIGVNDGTGDGLPGGGDPANPENWWYWPQMLGDPVTDYVFDEVEPDGLMQIIRMHRDFEFGRLEVFPRDGYARVLLHSSPDQDDDTGSDPFPGEISTTLGHALAIMRHAMQSGEIDVAQIQTRINAVMAGIPVSQDVLTAPNLSNPEDNELDRVINSLIDLWIEEGMSLEDLLVELAVNEPNPLI